MEISAAALAFLGLPDTSFGPHVISESWCIRSIFLRAGQKCWCAVSLIALMLQRGPAPTLVTAQQQGSRRVRHE